MISHFETLPNCSVSGYGKHVKERAASLAPASPPNFPKEPFRSV